VSNTSTRRLLRYKIIKHIFGRADFRALLEDDSFIPTKKNIAFQINEYAVEAGLWDKILIGDRKEVSLNTIINDLKKFKYEIEPLLSEIPWIKRRNTVISIIHSDDWLNEYHEIIGKSVRAVKHIDEIFEIIGDTVNEYAVKHNIWKENVSISILKKDVKSLYLKGKIDLFIKIINAGPGPNPYWPTYKHYQLEEVFKK